MVGYVLMPKPFLKKWPWTVLTRCKVRGTENAKDTFSRHLLYGLLFWSVRWFRHSTLALGNLTLNLGMFKFIQCVWQWMPCNNIRYKRNKERSEVLTAVLMKIPSSRTWCHVYWCAIPNFQWSALIPSSAQWKSSWSCSYRLLPRTW
jgi:hypothetical protein